MKNISKKIIILLLILIGLSNFYNNIFAAEPASEPVKVNCFWLPWCAITDISNIETETGISKNISLSWIWNLVWLLIQYVAVLAVISLMIAGLFYIFSGWAEEKTKKAKNWIIWSLVWVFVSISAWWIINLINSFQISAP